MQFRQRIANWGSIGGLLAAAACPICFPKLAAVGAVFGLGALAAYESQLIIAVQGFVVLAMAGHAVAFARHGMPWFPVLACASSAAFFIGYYGLGSTPIMEASLLGIALVSLGLTLRLRTGKHLPAQKCSREESLEQHRD